MRSVPGAVATGSFGAARYATNGSDARRVSDLPRIGVAKPSTLTATRSLSLPVLTSVLINRVPLAGLNKVGPVEGMKLRVASEHFQLHLAQ